MGIVLGKVISHSTSRTRFKGMGGSGFSRGWMANSPQAAHGNFLVEFYAFKGNILALVN